jgi:5'-nucleotidase
VNTNRLILITNDDGYDSKGIKALIEVMRPFGKVIAVAPEEGHSGMSHAITMSTPLRLKKVEESDNYTLYKCSGTPVDCVKIALDKILDRKPDLLVAGINHGANSSVSSLYSGTIAAALEGCINKIDAIGFSLLDHSPKADFTVAKIFVKKIINLYIEQGIPKETCLNINIPNISAEQIKGIKVCRQAKGLWVEEFEKRTDPNKQDYYWLTGSFLNYENHANDTDEWALNNNYISIVPLHIDLTQYEAIKQMKNWNI